MYAIFTEDGLDQVVETAAIMRRECQDLAAMGCDVWFYEVAPNVNIELWADANHGKRPRKPIVLGGGKMPARN